MADHQGGQPQSGAFEAGRSAAGVIDEMSCLSALSCGRGADRIPSMSALWRPQRTGAFMGGTIMQIRSRRLVAIVCAAMAGVSITALTASQPAAQYKMTVNK